MLSMETFIVDLRTNETLQTGAVGNRTYRAGESVYLFLEFTIVFRFPPASLCLSTFSLSTPPASRYAVLRPVDAK